jgi:serine/threonine-protein kinase
MLVAPQMLDILGMAASMAVLWRLYRGRPRSAPVLAGLDAGGMLLISLFSCLPLLGPGMGGEPAQGVFAISLLVIARAAIVPTPAVWTLAVSTLAMVPLLTMIGLYHAHERAGGWALSIASPLECAVAVTIATVVSSVIYGLRLKVQEARQLGQYTLENRLGGGGMGEVFRARHALLRRPTAVKMIRPGAAHAAALARFEREVQLTSILTHPNTISVYDYGHTADGTFYYAMEYVDGIDLDELARAHGPQAPARVVHILRQVCGSLAEAHGIGLIHRDIKPANVMLCERGGVPDVAKVLDFGLAREAVPAGDAALTRDDLVVGTPLFISPEALRAPEAVDARSDLYAVGGVAYYLLTGTPVFAGRTAVEVCSQHLQTPPEPPSARLGRPLPAALEEAVLRCLEKDPARRPQSAHELGLALAAGTDSGEWTEAQAREWWRRRQHGPRPPARGDTGVSQLLTVDLRDRAAAGQ